MPRKGKSKPTTGKRIGAKPGNKNALKHGFYSKQFTTEQNTRLNGQKPVDVESEIALIRICLDRLYHQIDMDPTYQQGKDVDGLMIELNQRDDHYLKQLNTLSIMNQSLATLVRTQHLVHGKTGDVQDSILRALEELRLEMGI